MCCRGHSGFEELLQLLEVGFYFLCSYQGLIYGVSEAETMAKSNAHQVLTKQSFP